MNFSDILIEGSGDSLILLAHGAGAPADSGFMNCLSKRLAGEGLTVLRFDFPYMQKSREDGRRRPPEAANKLQEAFRSRLELVRAQIGRERPLFIGGKSMGGRIASMLASSETDSGDPQGVVCFGYPFHPPGKLDRWRTAHFPDLKCPACIVQGTRDPFGRPEEVRLRSDIEEFAELHWLDGGDHDFKPLKRQGATQEGMIAESARIAAAFIRRRETSLAQRPDK